MSFHGHGLENNDQAKFVHVNATGYADCNDYSHNAVLKNPDESSNQHKNIISDNTLDHQATFTFDPSTSGAWVHLCYKFDNEPYQIYPLLKNQVHHVTNMTSFVGGPEYIVAHVKERLAIHGNYVTELDFGRWIHHTGSTDADCNDASLIFLSDDIASNNVQVNNQEPIVTNVSTAGTSPHHGREITFRFNSSYMGQSPKYCHKFKNEPYKIYPHLDTKIGHVYALHANVGSNDVAVVDYEKRITFIGGHVSSNDHVMWTLTSSSSCEAAIVNQHDSALITKGTGNTTVMLDGTNSALFNFTSANSGDHVRLCYQFGNEPYRTYVEHELDLRMIHNFTTSSGETNRSVVAYPKPITFFGHGLNKRSR